MSEFEIVPLNTLEWSEHDVPIGHMVQWRVYAQDASHVEERWTRPYFGKSLRITQRVTDGWYMTGASAKTLIEMAKNHGPGRYVIVMFTMKPFGNWRGQKAAVITVADRGEERTAVDALAYDSARGG